SHEHFAYPRSSVCHLLAASSLLLKNPSRYGCQGDPRLLHGHGPRGSAAGGAGRGGGGDVQPDAADPVRAGHHRERGAERGVLREAQGAPGELPVQVQEGPQPAALRQLPQRQEGLRRVQAAPAKLLSDRPVSSMHPSPSRFARTLRAVWECGMAWLCDVT
uniref:Uncharacterized protein n=1 Tax=Triticum urartu TaxID=4572 RepID=A0A8R7P3F4_TRIUA